MLCIKFMLLTIINKILEEKRVVVLYVQVNIESDQFKYIIIPPKSNTVYYNVLVNSDGTFCGVRYCYYQKDYGVFIKSSNVCNKTVQRIRHTSQISINNLNFNHTSRPSKSSTRSSKTLKSPQSNANHTQKDRDEDTSRDNNNDNTNNIRSRYRSQREDRTYNSSCKKTQLLPSRAALSPEPGATDIFTLDLSNDHMNEYHMLSEITGANDKRANSVDECVPTEIISNRNYESHSLHFISIDTSSASVSGSNQSVSPITNTFSNVIKNDDKPNDRMNMNMGYMTLISILFCLNLLFSSNCYEYGLVTRYENEMSQKAVVVQVSHQM